MDIKNLTLNVENALGTRTPILLSVDDRAVYENGEKTNKTYTAVTVTSVESNFEKVAVKVASCAISLSNEAIAERTCALDFVRVSFTNDKVKLYNISGETKITASADRVCLAETISDDTEITL